MRKSYSTPQRLRSASQGFSKWPQAIRDLCVLVLLAASITFAVVVVVPESAWSSTNAQPAPAVEDDVNGGITVATSGSVLFSLVKIGTTAETIKYGVGKRMRTFTFAADDHRRFIVMKGKRGQKAKLKVLTDDGFKRLNPNVVIPAKPYAHKANIRFGDDCTAVAAMTNRSEETLPYNAHVTSPVGGQSWDVTLGAHDYVAFNFDGKVIPPAGVVMTAVRLETEYLVLDIERRRC